MTGSIQIATSVKGNTRIIIVIPCYDEPHLLSILNNLDNCEPTVGAVEVIVVINSSEESPDKVIEQNKKTSIELDHWKSVHNKELLTYHSIVVKNIPPSKAGVGYPRKLGMDEAARRFKEIAQDGLIVSLDADCLVDTNYLKALENWLNENPEGNGGVIYFEHPYEIVKDNKTRDAIIYYELQLRYYIQSLKQAGHPHAFHTVGSCIFVRSSTYFKLGGMNSRKVGEDFYFLQKLIPLGNFSYLIETCIYPSCRVSNRLPFGTASTIHKYIHNENDLKCAYNPRIFEDLNAVLCLINKMTELPAKSTIQMVYKQLPESIQKYIAYDRFETKMIEAIDNSRNTHNFRKRFYAWFNLLFVLKYVHFSQSVFPDIELVKACNSLKGMTGENLNNKELLISFRKLERNYYS